MGIKRIFLEKKQGFDVTADALFNDFVHFLKIGSMEKVRVITRYDIEGVTDSDFEEIKKNVLAKPFVDVLSDCINLDGFKYFIMESLTGQYDQHADVLGDAIEFMTLKSKPLVRCAKIIAVNSEVSDSDFEIIKKYMVNPVESQFAPETEWKTLKPDYPDADDVKILEGFIDLDKTEIKKFADDLGLAMDYDDIEHCQNYFKNTEKRNPTFTEIKMIDTYWSDHCRHTTFLTRLNDVNIEDERIKSVYDTYLDTRKHVYEGREKNICLMDIATMAMKKLRKQGLLKNLEESEEINACSIEIDVDIVGGEKERWLLMFKNETHNHPTEIEPFGGASTCLGGGIRDPLSGRAYCYQAMRITGCADPTRPFDQTIKGKIPQRKITNTAAEGYSSYGNQIGLAAGYLDEVYDEGYAAKRMELGALVAAAPRDWVVRKQPVPGDVVFLLGERTGRDGCGGATGSSRSHTTESIGGCSAEVQKGNAPGERNIVRLFRNPNATKLIKRCNDFGAGGVSVAIGELADGLNIDLDVVPAKYAGLDGTELAISESQERMACVVAAVDADKFLKEANNENLEATIVATVTDTNRLVINWRGRAIVDISRDFLNTNGIVKNADADIKAVNFTADTLDFGAKGENLTAKMKDLLSSLNVCSLEALGSRFDSSVGAGTVLMPYGGKYQATPIQSMVAKIPVLDKDTTTGSVMAYGYNNRISRLSPFHGAAFAEIEAITKAVAVGANYKDIYLTLQEYFERLGDDKIRWGKPLAALLGAFHVQNEMSLAGVGGKDSMSGSFNDIDVPPAVYAFAVSPLDVLKVVSNEFKGVGNVVVMLKPSYDEKGLPNFDELKAIYELVYKLILDGVVKSSYAVSLGGVAEAVAKMSFGNKIGFEYDESFDKNDLFKAYYGSIILEINKNQGAALLGNGADSLSGVKIINLGITSNEPVINMFGEVMTIDSLLEVWRKTLADVFPAKADAVGNVKTISYSKSVNIKRVKGFAKPNVLIPAFQGCSAEYDVEQAFRKVGANVKTQVFKNLTPTDIAESIDVLVSEIQKSQIIALPNGFSLYDDAFGVSQYIAATFRNEKVKDAIEKFLTDGDGLIIGLGSGFDALLRLGLLPYGKISDMTEKSPVLTFNKIGRHFSGMVNTRVSSVISPWMSETKVGDIYTVPVSACDGRFAASDDVLADLEENGQIAAQYVDLDGSATMLMPYNPTGSFGAVESLTSQDGRIIGKMTFPERCGTNTMINIEGNKFMPIFEGGVKYFK